MPPLHRRSQALVTPVCQDALEHIEPQPLTGLTFMNKTFTAFVAVGALGLAACGGVDRDGTRDQFISDMQELGNTADGDCIDQVLAAYSDDDIEALSEGSENATTQALAEELIACTDLLGG
ncbi:MAG: hypothetical protein ACI9ME_001507 [Ilumatobacter sp.]|jgi:hypothetical protein